MAAELYAFSDERLTASYEWQRAINREDFNVGSFRVRRRRAAMNWGQP